MRQKYWLLFCEGQRHSVVQVHGQHHARHMNLTSALCVYYTTLNGSLGSCLRQVSVLPCVVGIIGSTMPQV